MIATPKLRAGQQIEMPDGSRWLVVKVTDCAAHVKQIGTHTVRIGDKEFKAQSGRELDISPHSEITILGRKSR